ncbi:short chain dehydrogenase [Moniliophthora roreri MCA 2997]|uniref:Short chain dehydrogenase n=1 Tax=Moniliophthora roreri (strain MCA 2997) TaxID=1381753 RepID=V2XGY0_MONRO|nr:short chain dehydrogenase [Moniliophthora roreri MCA 2997]
MFFDEDDAFDPQCDLVDLRGKVAIVTFSGEDDTNAYHTTLHLLRSGARVYLASPTEPTSIIKSLLWDFGYDYGEVLWLPLDLSDPKKARDAARQFWKEGRLDILVNNAAIVEGKGKGKESMNSWGLTELVTFNYISPFVFTRELLPLLAKTAAENANADVRIVNVVPATHKLIPTSRRFRTVDDLNVRGRRLPSGFLRYCHSKLLCLLWTRQLQTLINAEGIPNMIAMAVDPSSSSPHSFSPAHIHLPVPLKRLLSHEEERDGKEGLGYTTAFAAAGEAVWAQWERYKGVYLEGVKKPRIVGEVHEGATKEEQELWELTEKVLRVCRI